MYQGGETLLTNSFVLCEINICEHEIAPKARSLKTKEAQQSTKRGITKKISAHLTNPEYLIHPYVWYK